MSRNRLNFIPDLWINNSHFFFFFVIILFYLLVYFIYLLEATKPIYEKRAEWEKWRKMVKDDENMKFARKEEMKEVEEKMRFETMDRETRSGSSCATRVLGVLLNAKSTEELPCLNIGYCYSINFPALLPPPPRLRSFNEARSYYEGKHVNKRRRLCQEYSQGQQRQFLFLRFKGSFQNGRADDVFTWKYRILFKEFSLPFFLEKIT